MLHRGPGAIAVDPTTEQPYDDLLVQPSRLGELSREALADVITDAWWARAPARLRRRLDQR